MGRLVDVVDYGRLRLYFTGHKVTQTPPSSHIKRMATYLPKIGVGLQAWFRPTRNGIAARAKRKPLEGCYWYDPPTPEFCNTEFIKNMRELS